MVVAYATSMYAVRPMHPRGWRGVYRILSAPDPAQVKSGLEAALDHKESCVFYSAAKDDSVCYFAHCISQSGTYLSKMAGIEAGAHRLSDRAAGGGGDGIGCGAKGGQVEMKYSTVRPRDQLRRRASDRHAGFLPESLRGV